MPTEPPDAVRALCPGCGRTEGGFPCPRCGTETPTRYDPQPPETTAPAVLFLGVSLFAASGLLLLLVPPPWGPAGGVILGAVGTGLSGMATWSLRDPPRPWQIVAPQAVGIGVVQGGALTYTHGQRTASAPVDPAAHQELVGAPRDELRAALRARVDAPEKSARAWPSLWLLARVARGEARAQQRTVVHWADGIDQPPHIDVEELRSNPDGVVPAPDVDAEEALAAWIVTHPVWWEAMLVDRT